MIKEDFTYLNMVFLHVAIGATVQFIPFISIFLGYGMYFFWIIYIIKKQNRNNEVLIAAAYIVGSEVFLRMTGGNPLYEITKYGVIIFLLIGMYYKGISRGVIPYWIFLLLLVPGLVLSTSVLSFESNMRTTIMFNISGPVCLGIASLYTFRRKISLENTNDILLAMGLPIVTCMTYVFIHAPSTREIITGTSSSSAASGGFGPNQVATIFGLGMFVFFSRIILSSKTSFQVVLNAILALCIGYRGLVTFSRGGMITGILMLGLLLLFLYQKSNFKGRVKLSYIMILIGFTLSVGWIFTVSQTSGLINNRYANQNANGEQKESKFTGREDIAMDEIDLFLQNPIFGVGVGRGYELRTISTGDDVLSHDEITRMLAEHGSFGVLGLLILIVTPLVLYLENKFNMFLLCFVVFWFLTINHAAMRLAVPAFVYSLSLLNLQLGSPEKLKEEE
ncbi:hypothetical protein CXF59_07245 [Flavobacterium sp. ALD4]|uniref:O-antigen ligase family protein n=1 Tax=Flavobacterium sp. ALD4 TaxID=2058314 RepID=UPI000C31BD19|nr:O-antigen ligase family protein [Flavobacterium sp. ALD4]PKH67694.1 hypothetical protein CXF59_07245 [Flavobacterium sp. ALD4]